MHNDTSIALMNSEHMTDRLADVITRATTAGPAPATFLCSRCLTPKAPHEFYPSDQRRRIRRCKDCRNEVQRQRWIECKALVEKLKDIPCPDCGIRWPPQCMEFDHRDPAEKDISLSQIVASGSMTRLTRELTKGEFVCANCHRIRTGNFAYRTGFTGRARPGQWAEAHQHERSGQQ